jgi:hypothetical protein
MENLYFKAIFSPNRRKERPESTKINDFFLTFKIKNLEEQYK